MKLKDMNALLQHEVKDLLHAEKQLVKALPKMAAATSNPKLRNAMEHHFEETKNHVARLEEVCEHLDIPARGQKCAAMEGLIEEAQEILDADADDDVRDAALIAAAQRVEHYEIAGYGSARTFAQELGLKPVVKLLQATLDEESKADKKLTEIAEGRVNAKAVGAGAS